MLDFNTYVELSQRTKKDFGLALGAQGTDLLHGAIGICGEAGELIDAIKKHCIYGKPLDKENVIEELGDIMWYVALVMHAQGLKMSDVLQANVDKLAKRYPEHYTDYHAAVRLDKEGGN